MPELPEVETIRAGIEEYLEEGSVLTDVEVYDAQFMEKHSLLPEQGYLIGQIYKGVSRKGKVLVVALDRGYVGFHLGMSGQIVTDLNNTRYPNHKKYRLVFGDKSLFYIDIRKFGWIRYVSTPDEIYPTGEDPTHMDYNKEKVIHKITTRSGPVKTILMDQNVIAGIGNIYASEILFRAGIHPGAPGNAIPSDKYDLLLKIISDVLQEGIEHFGTTFSIFQNLKGETGRQQNFLRVYGREGEGCRICGSRIVKIIQAGRSTFFCEKCQGQL